MNSIDQRFLGIQRKNEDWSSYICFVETVRGRSYTKRTITEWFKKLVEEADYTSKDKRAVLGFLYTL